MSEEMLRTSDIFGVSDKRVEYLCKKFLKAKIDSGNVSELISNVVELKKLDVSKRELAYVSFILGRFVQESETENAKSWMLNNVGGLT